MTIAYSTGSVKALGSCHPDLVKVFIQAGEIVPITIVEGGITIDETTDLRSEQLHRPSDALRAVPAGCGYEPKDSQELARWYYVGRVVTGVAQTLYDRGAIESPIEWMGEEDLTRYRRSGTDGR